MLKNNNEPVNRFIKKITLKSGKVCYVPVAHIFKVNTVFEDKNNGLTFKMSSDNTCKTAESLRNTFGFFSTADVGGRRKEFLDAQEQKLAEEAEQLKRFLIKYGFISEAEYEEINQNHNRLTAATRRAGELFNSLCHNAEILSLNFVGKADRDADGCLYVAPNNNENKQTCLLERLVDLLGPSAQDFEFLSKYRRCIDSRRGHEKYLPVLLPEVRERISVPGADNWRVRAEARGIDEYHNELVENNDDSEIHGDFTEDGERITKNLLKLCTKGRCQFVEKDFLVGDHGEKKTGFEIDLSEIKNSISEKISDSGFLEAWNEIINSNQEELISRNELCERIRNHEQELLDIDFGGVKITHEELINEIDIMYREYGGIGGREAFLHDDNGFTVLKDRILELLIDKHFGILSDEIKNFYSESRTNKFDMIHHLQAICYAILGDLYRKLLEAKENQALDEKIEEFRPRFEKLGTILESIINGGEGFDELLEEAQNCEGSLHDFIVRKIMEIYDNDLDEDSLKEIFRMTAVISKSLCDERWAHATQVNLIAENKTEPTKLKNGFTTDDGDFVVPFCNLYDMKAPNMSQSGIAGTREYIDQNGVRHRLAKFNKEPVIKEVDQANRNIFYLKKIIDEYDAPEKIENATQEEVEDLLQKGDNFLYKDYITEDPELLNLIAIFEKSPEENADGININVLNPKLAEYSQEIKLHIDGLLNEIKKIYDNSNLDDRVIEDLKQKTVLSKNVLKNYINFSDTSQIDKQKYLDLVDSTEPNFLGILWQAIKQLFSFCPVSFKDARVLRRADNTKGVFDKLKQSDIKLPLLENNKSGVDLV